MCEQSAVIGVLYLSAVTFFALWRFERTRRVEITLMIKEESDRQRAVLGAIERAEFDEMRENV